MTEPMRLPTLTEVRAEQCRRSLARFIRDSWHVLEPSTPLEWNWHIDAVAEHVQAVLEDWMARQLDPAHVQRIQNLVVNIPPGTSKSRVISVCAPAWMWTIWPSWRVIALSADPRVALRDAGYHRDLIGSEWYQDTFRPTWELKDDQDAKGLFGTTAGGTRQSLGWFAKITGSRADALIVDDPNDPIEVYSDLVRGGVNDRWDTTIRNRVNSPSTSVRIGVMQRLHEDDWAGHVLRKGGWEHLRIPQEHESAEERKGACACVTCARGVTALGWRDPRMVGGELLMPKRFTPAVLAQERIDLGSAGYAGQHQQRPSSPEGGLLKREWWKRYTAAFLRELQLDEVLFSWDCTFKATTDTDFVVGQAWGRKGANFYLLDQVRARMGFGATVRAVIDLRAAWRARGGDHGAVLIEDKANGSAVIETLSAEVPGVIAVNPEGGKQARAAAVSPKVEAGNVWLPAGAPWVLEFIEECATFPRGAHDDQVDAMSQALLRMAVAGEGDWLERLVSAR